MVTRRRSWNRQQSDEEDDGHHDALHDEVVDFEAELLGLTTPLSTEFSGGNHCSGHCTTTNRNEEEG
ncbi:hypothetical protein RvY_07589 [Ramazzottius varieornatus]|uniref:Uncharacterized protein n=1 Tax=Ramazzottius varieornatus TaxID=947166 RepID=A0A1D1VC64_RAMVA|nr:hypothetical protein RvY_07589 [Ramazzottius varieornatus]